MQIPRGFVAVPLKRPNQQQSKITFDLKKDDFTKEEKQVQQDTLLVEMTNIKGQANTGTVNQASAGGGSGGLGGIFDSISNIINGVKGIIGTIKGIKDTVSGKSNTNNSYDGTLLDQTSAIAEAIGTLVKNKPTASTINSSIRTIMKNIPALQASADPFGRFFTKYIEIYNDLQDLLGRSYSSADIDKVLNNIGIGKNLVEIVNIANEYYSSNNINSTYNSIDSMFQTTDNMANTMLGNIKYVNDKEQEIIEHNAQIRKDRDKYYEKTIEAELNRLKNNSTEEAYKPTDKEIAMSAIRNIGGKSVLY